MASQEGISVDTVANVDVNIVEQYKGKIIARDLRLGASRLYKAGITRPWTRHVQPCHYTILGGSESSDSNKDEYDRRNALCVWNSACGFRTDIHFADVPNEPIPTYGHSWTQPHGDNLQQDTDRAIRNDETAIGGRYAT